MAETPASRGQLVPVKEAWGPRKLLSRINWYYVPVVNVMYDMLFDDVPTMEQVQGLMTAFALMDALLITMAGSLMTTIDKDQAASLRTTIDGFVAQQDIKLFNNQVINPYDRYLIFSYVSFGAITAALFQVLLMYLGCGAINFNTCFGKDSKNALTAWWLPVRWVFILMLGFTALGMASLAISTSYAWSMQNADTADHLAAYIWWSDAGNYLFMVIAGIIAPILLLSWGLINKERSLSKYKDLAKSFSEETVESLVHHVGSGLGRDKASLDEIVKTLVEKHWLLTVADLLALDLDGWARLELPLRLEAAMREEIFSDDMQRHNERQSKAKEPLQAIDGQPREVGRPQAVLMEA